MSLQVKMNQSKATTKYLSLRQQSIKLLIEMTDENK